MLIPHYGGGTIADLAAELELRLAGSTVSTPLHPSIADRIPTAETYVLVMIDGLGSWQLGHPAATALQQTNLATLHAVFPTTTSAGLASIATGFAPARHGLIAHQLMMHGMVVNTLKWQVVGGDPVPFDTTDVLPAPNLWERLATTGIEPIVVQPGSFLDTPLSRALYRGARFEAVWTYEELIDATVQLAAAPGRLIFTYLADVDFAAHVHGADSAEYSSALKLVADVWERIGERLPAGAVAVATADHGLIDYPPERKIAVRRPAELRLYGDPRVVLVRGDFEEAARLADDLPCTWVPIDGLRLRWGPGPEHPDLPDRLPAGALVADRDYVLLPRGMDRRMVGYHGGLDEREVEVPLLIND